MLKMMMDGRVAVNTSDQSLDARVSRQGVRVSKVLDATEDLGHEDIDPGFVIPSEKMVSEKMMFYGRGKLFDDWHDLILEVGVLR